VAAEPPHSPADGKLCQSGRAGNAFTRAGNNTVYRQHHRQGRQAAGRRLRSPAGHGRSTPAALLGRPTIFGTTADVHIAQAAARFAPAGQGPGVPYAPGTSVARPGGCPAWQIDLPGPLSFEPGWPSGHGYLTGIYGGSDLGPPRRLLGGDPPDRLRDPSSMTGSRDAISGTFAGLAGGGPTRRRFVANRFSKDHPIHGRPTGTDLRPDAKTGFHHPSGTKRRGIHQRPPQCPGQPAWADESRRDNDLGPRRAWPTRSTVLRRQRIAFLLAEAAKRDQNSAARQRTFFFGGAGSNDP